MPRESMGPHMVRSWCMPRRPQGLGHIGYVGLRLQYNMKSHMAVESNTKQCHIMLEGKAYASYTQKLHLMMT
jgi:hypothetical protein